MRLLKRINVFLFFILPVFGFAQQLAFPGAEGYGRYTVGGRGGDVYYVTTLDDYLTDYIDPSRNATPISGSLRYGIQERAYDGNGNLVPRTIVFKVGGIIDLEAPLCISEGKLTIAGQTAPGHGICLRRYPLLLGFKYVGVRYDALKNKLGLPSSPALDFSIVEDVIIRYIRCRPGDYYDYYYTTDEYVYLRDVATGNELERLKDEFIGNFRLYKGNGSALTVLGKNVIIDHCSLSWGTDQTFNIERMTGSVSDGIQEPDRISVQWNIISETLLRKKGTSGEHSKGVFIKCQEGTRVSLSNNLIVSHDFRSPLISSYEKYTNFDSKPDGMTADNWDSCDNKGFLVDMINNIVYNWGRLAAHNDVEYTKVNDDYVMGAFHKVYLNFINNYYYAGDDRIKYVTDNEFFRTDNFLAEGYFNHNWYKDNNGSINEYSDTNGNQYDIVKINKDVFYPGQGKHDALKNYLASYIQNPPGVIPTPVPTPPATPLYPANINLTTGIVNDLFSNFQKNSRIPDSVVSDNPLGGDITIETDRYRLLDIINRTVGASHRRDAVDERIINQMHQNNGKIIKDIEELFNDFKESENWENIEDVWSDLKGKYPADDTDADGMPDYWELEMEFDMNDPSDRNLDHDNDGYTNLEEYLNCLAYPREFEENTVAPVVIQNLLN